MTPPDGVEGLGPGIAQARQKNGRCEARPGDKWPVVGRSQTKFHYICIMQGLSSKQRQCLQLYISTKCTNTSMLMMSKMFDLLSM